MDILDLVGLHFVITRVCAKTDLKYLVAALGWTSAELIVTKFVLADATAAGDVGFRRFLPLWVGARGIEFDWQYIQMSLDSNIALVSRDEAKGGGSMVILVQIQHLSVAMLLWLRTRHDLNRSYIPLINVLLLLSCYRSVILE